MHSVTRKRSGSLKLVHAVPPARTADPRHGHVVNLFRTESPDERCARDGLVTFQSRHAKLTISLVKTIYWASRAIGFQNGPIFFFFPNLLSKSPRTRRFAEYQHDFLFYTETVTFGYSSPRFACVHSKDFISAHRSVDVLSSHLSQTCFGTIRGDSQKFGISTWSTRLFDCLLTWTIVKESNNRG